ncbi:MAG: phytanoyl-CoA dioxygenase family protein [Pseudomonadales bacterium]
MISDADKHRFSSQGFLVLERLVPEELCSAARAAIAGFLGIDEQDPSSWHRPNLQGHGIVPLHHAQALWDLRQFPAVHQAFADLYGTARLWVSIDRASFKAPADGFDGPYRTDPIHWDAEPRQIQRLSIQGLIYLTDTSTEQGGFCCVPDLYRDLAGYLRRHPTDPAPRQPDVNGYTVQTVSAPAGSLVLWDRRMPHSSGENRSNRPRWVAYVAMEPAGDESARAALAALYREKRPPQWAVRQQVAGQQIPEPGEPARLTDLGRRLTGLDRWP